MFGVDEQRANAEGFSHVEHPADCIEQEALAETVPLSGFVHGQSGEQHHGNRIHKKLVL